MMNLLLLSLYLIGWFGQPVQPDTSIESIHVSGVCHDLTTAVYLPVEIYAMSGTGRTRLGQSDEDGRFRILLPLSATSISFTSPNYRTVTLPVAFVNNPTRKADFRVGITMGKQDSVAVRQADQLIVSNDLPDDVDVKYTVDPTDRQKARTLAISAHGYRVPPGLNTTFRKGKIIRSLTFEGAQPGPYQALVSTTDGRVLIDKAFTLNKGLTFLEVRPDAPAKPVPDKPTDEKRVEKAAPSTATVYFDQSRYELTPETKASLDSVARLMKNQPQLLAHVTGYTDHVGEQKLNLTLSEFRAKLVAGYLKNQGIADARLRVDWQGGNALVSPGDSEAEKARNRRVIIQFSRP
ncbi:OmpA family protein [Spirosoma rhododendri]|uniref:OmpA family protein n=1 Tax=Spirosoma rhododendri TaxID=2728024 RepID=A0A7L5DP46_9BACT|nr:OmpA family protein [Spirosoma rhododendri]QJD80229.1 OmpA family protein [Spirosoma rhododendri]